MKVLVTGREGQVVSALLEAARYRTGIELVAVGRPELDLSDPGCIDRAVTGHAPNLIVSAAAYTAVDQAEDEPELAFAVNATGPKALATPTARLGVPIIHLSTDYVFPGDYDRAYVETDATGPAGVYGASKLAGELAIAAANRRHLVLRTAWVYSAYGKNFLKTMLQLARHHDVLSVVSDQWGNPTSAHDIADAILHIVGRLERKPDFTDWGVYHLAGTGEVNWSGFARHILDTSRAHGGPYARVSDIGTSAYPTKARRPANSRLDSSKIGAVFGWRSPDWRQSTKDVVQRLTREAACSPSSHADSCR